MPSREHVGAIVIGQRLEVPTDTFCELVLKMPEPKIHEAVLYNKLHHTWHDFPMSSGNVRARGTLPSATV